MTTATPTPRLAPDAQRGSHSLQRLVGRHSWCVLIHADCLTVMDELREVDAVVTDPPYNIGWRPRVNHQNDGWTDNEPFDPAPWLKIGSKHLFWGGNYIADKLACERRNQHAPAPSAANHFMSAGKETPSSARRAVKRIASNAESLSCRSGRTTGKSSARRNAQATHARAQNRRGWPQTVASGRAPTTCTIGTSKDRWRLIGGLPSISVTITPARSAGNAAGVSTRITSSRSKTSLNSLLTCPTGKRSACRATKRLTLSAGRNTTHGERPRSENRVRPYRARTGWRVAMTPNSISSP